MTGDMTIPFGLQVLCILLILQQALCSFTCSVQEDCSHIGPGSECKNGICSNPFEQGCLKQYLAGWNDIRVCNSHDPPDAEERGICKSGEFNYPEVRLVVPDWQSVVYESWWLQIILSEVFGIPVSLEPGSADGELNFYDAKSSFRLGFNPIATAFQKASELVDCRKASRDPENYEPCGHLQVERWNTLANRTLAKRIMEPRQAMGAIGSEGWFLPKFTAQQDPSLLTYLGMQGEANRKKLADIFLRPTRWRDYCVGVSKSNCTIPDNIANRPPRDEYESNNFFVEGLYSGHFQKTDENDCEKNPTTCTGHIAGYPCNWRSPMISQLYHNQIALSSSGNSGIQRGYEYSELQQIWKAANATKSHVVMCWWQPTPEQVSFMDSDAAFLRVELPTATQECITHRPTSACAGTIEELIGDPRGSCDEETLVLDKLISNALYRLVEKEATSIGQLSPAYDVVNLFRITTLQMMTLMQNANQASNPRDGVCKFIAENWDLSTEFIPRTYPRVTREVDQNSIFLYASMCLVCLALLFVIFAFSMVYARRKTKKIRIAQIDFLLIVLLGLCMVCCGAILTIVPPSVYTCVAATWLINIGYTLELVPIIVKVSAINRLIEAAKKMKRQVVNRRNLLSSQLLISSVTIIFLVMWTIYDPPKKTTHYVLTDKVTDDGETVVDVDHTCRSDSKDWEYIGVGWNSVMLICATAFAYQMRQHPPGKLDESTTLAFMIYSNFVFLMLRLGLIFITGSISEQFVDRGRVIILSVDTIASVSIYFFPKFFGKDDELDELRQSGVRQSARVSGFSARNAGITSEYDPHLSDFKFPLSNNTKPTAKELWIDEEPCPTCGWSGGSSQKTSDNDLKQGFPLPKKSVSIVIDDN